MKKNKKTPKFTKFVANNSRLVIGVLIGVLIMTTGIALASKINSPNVKKDVSTKGNTSNDGKNDTQSKDNKSASNSAQQPTSSTASPGGAGSNTSNAPTPSAPAEPTIPSTMNYTFFSGTYTPQAFPNYPNSGYTGSGNISGTLNAQGYSNLRLSWNKSLNLQLRVQGSADGASWSDFYTYNSPSGSVTIPVTAAYYRVFSYIGNCLGGSPCVDAELNTPYSLNFTGLLTK